MSEVIDILKNTGAILTDGHFVGTSGLHFDTYVNKDYLYPHTKETSRVCRLFAEKYKDADIDVVVGPALGGIIVSQWVASHLSEIYGKEVLGIYTEKASDSGQVFTRGYEKYVKDGKRVLVVEDIITTGISVLKSIKAVREAGGNVVGACAIVNKTRDLDKNIFDTKFETLADVFVDTYKVEDCPLCKNGVPINTNVGHGKKFLASQK